MVRPSNHGVDVTRLIPTLVAEGQVDGIQLQDGGFPDPHGL